MTDQPTIDEALRALVPSARRPAPDPEPEKRSVGSPDGGVRQNLPDPPPDVNRLLRTAIRGYDDER